MYVTLLFRTRTLRRFAAELDTRYAARRSEGQQPAPVSEDDLDRFMELLQEGS